jgi:hypothetical protein
MRLAAVLLLFATSACGVHGLDLKTDKRLTFISPKDRAKVTLPLTISWRVHGFTVTGPDGSQRSDAGYFGVYLDRAPQPPNRSQSWLLRDDTDCKRFSTCAHADVLAQSNIFSTQQPHFTIAQLPLPPTSSVKRREFHDVTVALLDGRGDRIGESAFRLRFEVDRGATD